MAVEIKANESDPTWMTQFERTELLP